MLVREHFGNVCGDLLSPVTGFISRIRHARMFHPDGVVYGARVEVIEGAPADLRRLASSLEGSALVRLSSAWWRGGKEWPDVLGMAMRFMPSPESSDDGDDDTQDLLFATVRFPWTTPFAPLATRVSTFAWNHFHAVSPFAVAGVGRVKLRLRSPRLANRDGESRTAHLANLVAVGDAVYELQVRRLDRSLLRRRWTSFARIVLERPVDVDQAALRFSPFRSGRGIRPVGFVHNLRRGTYAASQAARPRRSREAQFVLSGVPIKSGM